jgi:pimeloyl-ACP methyl ester carboxylesterase
MATTKKSTATRFGDIAYREAGGGPPALFLHGVFMSGLLWEDAIAKLSEDRRCIAIDLPAHGRTKVKTKDLSVQAHVEMIEDFCETLELGRIDLVGNDTGGALAQIMAVRDPSRLRTLTLTNCDVHTNLPPDAFKAVVELAAAGGLAPVMQQAAKDPDQIRTNLSVAYEHPEKLSDEKVLEYFEPFATEEGAREIEHRINSLTGSEDLTSIESKLRKLDVPTLIVWGTADQYSDIKWAHWLRDTIPGASEVVEIEGGKLFFPDERADELVPHIRKHWAANPE